MAPRCFSCAWTRVDGSDEEDGRFYDCEEELREEEEEEEDGNEDGDDARETLTRVRRGDGIRESRRFVRLESARARESARGDGVYHRSWSTGGFDVVFGHTHTVVCEEFGAQSGDGLEEFGVRGRAAEDYSVL